MWRVLVVEDELCRFVLSRLQEAHHLSIVGCLSIPRFLTSDLGNETMCHDLRLEVGC